MTTEAILRKLHYEKGSSLLMELRLVLHKLEVIKMGDSMQDWYNWVMKYRVR